MRPKKPSKPSANSKLANAELQHIEQLLHFMSEHNLEEFEYSQGDLKIRLKKPSAGLALTAHRQFAAPEIIIPGVSLAPPHAAPEPAAAPPGGEARSTEDLHLVKSPIVGTYYESPSPGSEAFVKVGGYVETGQPLFGIRPSRKK